jgi:hypothetical protein
VCHAMRQMRNARLYPSLIRRANLIAIGCK